MGVAAADYDCDGHLDIVKTNFAGDTSSLYHNPGMSFRRQTFQAGLGRNTRFLGWGVGFIDFDNDGWSDIFVGNGHVYPEVAETSSESGYRERKVLYRNLGNGKFADVSLGGRLRHSGKCSRPWMRLRRFRQRRRPRCAGELY